MAIVVRPEPALPAGERQHGDRGMDDVERDEASLLAYAHARLHAVAGVSVYGVGDVPPRLDDRVGVIAFNVGSLPHSLVAAILGYEAGIGVRSGCFCAQSYVAHLLGRATAQQDWSPSERLAAQRAERPGMVRVSLGVYNTCGDIDALVDMLERIDQDDFRGHYCRAPGSGDYRPLGHEDAIFSYFSLPPAGVHHAEPQRPGALSASPAPV